MRLSLGKLPPELMDRYIFGMTGARSKRVVVEPSSGLDFGVVRVGRGPNGRGYLIISSDPITGVSERAGWYAVNVSANDVATSGNRPGFMQSIMLLPEDASERDVGRLADDMHRTASKLGIAIVGGHTELSPGLKRPIVVTTAFSLVDKYVTAAGARDGDTLMMTKTAGVEGTAILGTDARFNRDVERRTVTAARKYFEKLSVVEEAVRAYETGAVHAMHDCTEGGVLGALYEIATASRLGLQVAKNQVPVSPETREICASARVDPLKLISSGTLLIAVEKGREDLVGEAVASAGSHATSIGRFSNGQRKVLLTTSRSDGGGSGRERKKDESMVGEEKAVEVTGPPTDEIWRLHLSTPRG